MKKPKNMQELKKMRDDKKEGKKEMDGDTTRHAKMKGLMQELMSLMEEKDMQEMMDEKVKESSPTVKSAK